MATRKFKEWLMVWLFLVAFAAFITVIAEPLLTQPESWTVKIIALILIVLVWALPVTALVEKIFE